MPRTLGYHFVKSCYGLWLPGDDRGHWSEAWDDQIGYYEPHMLHDRDPARKRMAEERMKHPPVKLNSEMICVVIEAIGKCAAESPWKIVAASVESTHTHLALMYTTKNIDNTCMWIADQTTKAVHRLTNHKGPIWGKGKWCTFIYDEDYWRNTIAYIERHNLRRGESAQPYPFISV